jgi:hypothetical protein
VLECVQEDILVDELLVQPRSIVRPPRQVQLVRALILEGLKCKTLIVLLTRHFFLDRMEYKI